MNFQRFVPEDFSGVIHIEHRGEPLVYKAMGYADQPNKRPNRLDTRFVTASAGKAFTAAGILKLVEQGKLGLEDTIGGLLDLDWGEIDAGITVRELITHTSGIPDYCDESQVPVYSDIFRDFPCYRIRRNADFIPMFIHMPMTDPRGTRFHYNNTGFVVLGLIIEAVSGMPFDAYLEGEVFTPCSMDSTRYLEYDRLPANCANVYILDGKTGEYYTNIYSSSAKGTGDGGAFTTAPDVKRFWKGLFGGKILGGDMVREMASPQVEPGCYGLGLWLEKIRGRNIPHFEGCEEGISFISTYDPEEEFLATFLSNRGDNVWELTRKVLGEFYGGVAERFDFGE